MSPNEICHKEKSELNYRCYELINKSSTDFIEWEATTLFYGALHCVHHFFASLPSPKHPIKHGVTNKLVSRHLRRYAPDYLRAYQISRWARYDDTVITNRMRNECLKCYNDVKKIIP